MCLTSLNKKRIATKDIIVWKHIVRVSDSRRDLLGLPTNFVTSYQRASITIGETFTSKLKVDTDIDNKPIVKIGLHAYRTQNVAQREARSVEEVLVRCIIPKGSEYITGLHDYGTDPAIASNTMVYNKIIPYLSYYGKIIE